MVPADRQDGRRNVCARQVGARPHVREVGVSTRSDSRAHHSTAIVIGKVVAQYLRHGVPVASRKARHEAFSHLACRVFQVRRGLLSCSNFASAASRSASSKTSQRLTLSPSTVKRSIPRHSASKPSREMPCPTWVMTAPRLLEPMYSLDVKVRRSWSRSIPARQEHCDAPAWRDHGSPSGRHSRDPVSVGELVSDEHRWLPVITDHVCA